MTSPLGERDDAADEIGDLGRFRIHSRAEIVALLRAIASHRELVTVEFGGSHDFILSVVLAIDQDAGAVVLDHGADPEAMRRLLRAPRLRVVTQLERVRVQFQSGSAQSVVHEGRPALRMRLPESVLRFQKRDTYRLKVPLSRPLTCEIPQSETGAARTEARVRDISVEGVGLTDYPRGFHVAAGVRWQDCRIRLAELGTLVADLDVMRVVDGERPRCGCRFRDLPPAMENLVQRYITRVEREQRATR